MEQYDDMQPAADDYRIASEMVVDDHLNRVKVPASNGAKVNDAILCSVAGVTGSRMAIARGLCWSTDDEFFGEPNYGRVGELLSRFAWSDDLIEAYAEAMCLRAHDILDHRWMHVQALIDTWDQWDGKTIEEVRTFLDPMVDSTMLRRPGNVQCDATREAHGLAAETVIGVAMGLVPRITCFFVDDRGIAGAAKFRDYPPILLGLPGEYGGHTSSSDEGPGAYRVMACAAEIARRRSNDNCASIRDLHRYDANDAYWKPARQFVDRLWPAITTLAVKLLSDGVATRSDIELAITSELHVGVGGIWRRDLMASLG